MDKLEKKNEKEEDELERCLLLIDGVNEHGNKKPVIRRKVHLLTFMHKQKHKKELLKPKLRNTRLHQAPVFNIYKPNNENLNKIAFIEEQWYGSQ